MEEKHPSVGVRRCKGKELANGNLDPLGEKRGKKGRTEWSFACREFEKKGDCLSGFCHKRTEKGVERNQTKRKKGHRGTGELCHERQRKKEKKEFLQR